MFRTTRHLTTLPTFVVLAALLGACSSTAGSGIANGTPPPSPASATVSPSPTPSDTTMPTPTSTPETTPSPTLSVSAPSQATSAALSGDITDGRIEITGGGKLGPNLYDVQARPGYEAYVYTAAGRLGPNGCYVQWRVVNNGKLLDTKRTSCAAQPSFSEVYWPNSIKYEVGTVEVTANITTDWGATKLLKVTFQTVAN